MHASLKAAVVSAIVTVGLSIPRQAAACLVRGSCDRTGGAFELGQFPAKSGFSGNSVRSSISRTQASAAFFSRKAASATTMFAKGRRYRPRVAAMVSCSMRLRLSVL